MTDTLERPTPSPSHLGLTESRLVISVPSEMKRRVAAIAEMEGASISSWARAWLSCGLDVDERFHRSKETTPE